jgi:hypothetical protein
MDGCVIVRFEDHTKLCSNKKVTVEITWHNFFANLEIGSTCRWRMLLDLDEK